MLTASLTQTLSIRFMYVSSCCIQKCLNALEQVAARSVSNTPKLQCTGAKDAYKYMNRHTCHQYSQCGCSRGQGGCGIVKIHKCYTAD